MEPLTAAERYTVQEGAAAADRASLLAIIDAYEATCAALEAERDAARAERAAHRCPQYTQHHHSRLLQLRRTIAERDAAEARATRLAALEAAARAVRQTNWDEYEGIEALVVAVAALDATPR